MLAPAQVFSTALPLTDRQRGWGRASCFAGAAMLGVLGLGFYRQWDWATGLWPLPDVRMTFVFLASMAAAIAAPLAWTGWRNDLGVLRALAFAGMIGVPVMGLYLLWLGFDRRDREFAFSGIALLGIGVGWAVIARMLQHEPLRDNRPLPGAFRAGGVVILGILILVGGTLALQVDDIFPWTISPETSTMIGLIFLTAALLFGWMVAHPRRAYTEMGLVGFLAYNLVLAYPYLDLLRNRNDTEVVSDYYGGGTYAASPSDNGINEVSLVVYLSVLAITSVLAVVFFVMGRARSDVPGA